jgi:UrcA family protein
MLKFAVLSTATLVLAAAMPAAVAAQPTVSEVTVRAHPRPGVEVKSKVVNYRDLNIKTPEGVQTLLGRIRQASEEVCSPVPDSIRNIGDFSNYEGCKTDAMHGALAQVKSPALSAVYGRVR